MITLNGIDLTIEQVYRVARMGESVELDVQAENLVNASNSSLKNILNSNKPIYGINTGFGIFSNTNISPMDRKKINRNLILSHAVATGEPIEKDIVRAAMLIRANALAKGFSGVRVIVIKTLLEMLNKQLTPIVPSQGSLGSSGDLSLLSHLALVFTTDTSEREDESGIALYKGKEYPGKEAMKRAQIGRIELEPKEGLALNNGATFCAAYAALAVYDAVDLVNKADQVTSMTLEALCGCTDAFDERIHKARNHPGQIESARRITEQLFGSTLIDSKNRIQDAYSLRCAPQVHGAVRDTVNYVKTIVEREINAATDNPLIFDQEEVLSGGNFHGEPLGLSMDYLGIAVTELGSISERRSYRLTDSTTNFGLPPMLVASHDSAGLNSGLMMLQYTAASLVLENQVLATPDSVRSLPTSGGQEDHNANATSASRHASQIIRNTRHILAIEFYISACAVDIRLALETGANLGKGTNKVYSFIRSIVPYKKEDCIWAIEIEKLKTELFSDKPRNILGKQ